MKIVIDIPEQIYESFKTYSECMAERIIAFGTPLPDSVEHYNAIAYMQGLADGLNASMERSEE